MKDPQLFPRLYPNLTITLLTQTNSTWTCSSPQILLAASHFSPSSPTLTHLSLPSTPPQNFSKLSICLGCITHYVWCKSLLVYVYWSNSSWLCSPASSSSFPLFRSSFSQNLTSPHLPILPLSPSLHSHPNPPQPAIFIGVVVGVNVAGRLVSNGSSKY